ncbi:MAG TPA: hypothetical protein VIM33_04955 [Gaiellaceae bacterium]
MGKLVGMLIGAGLALALAIAYDTSAQTAALEGGRGHLKFGGILFFAVVGAIIGLPFGAWFDLTRARRTQRPPSGD